MNNLSLKDEVVIHLIRIGHTRLTHKYLMEDRLKRVPRCDYCNLDSSSVLRAFVKTTIEWPI